MLTMTLLGKFLEVVLLTASSPGALFGFWQFRLYPIIWWSWLQGGKIMTVSCIVAVNSGSWECVFGVKVFTSAFSIGLEACISSELYSGIHFSSYLTSITYCLYIIETNQLMLPRGILADYYENHMKYLKLRRVWEIKEILYSKAGGSRSRLTILL
jgi:hypothetical protein